MVKVDLEARASEAVDRSVKQRRRGSWRDWRPVLTPISFPTPGNIDSRYAAEGDRARKTGIAFEEELCNQLRFQKHP